MASFLIRRERKQASSSDISSELPFSHDVNTLDPIPTRVLALAHPDITARSPGGSRPASFKGLSQGAMAEEDVPRETAAVVTAASVITTNP